MNVCVVKLNGWPETFDERILALATAVDSVTLVRSKPRQNSKHLSETDKVDVYDIPPVRGNYIEPGYLKPFVYSAHVLAAIVLISYLLLVRDRSLDVVHALDYVVGGTACAMISWLFSIPFVVSVRGLKEPRYESFVEEQDTLTARVKFKILTSLTGRVVPAADHVVTKSTYQVQFVRDRFGVTANISTLPTGVDFEKFDPETVTGHGALASLDTEQDIHESNTAILYLAKLVPEKGVDVLFEHIAQIDESLPDDVVFIFVGEVRSEVFKQRLQRLRQSCPQRIVLYPHRVPFESVPGLLADADAVMLLSEPDTEGVPRILQESCAMRTPIIASDVTGIANAFCDISGCYLVDRTSSKAFERAVLNVVKGTESVDRELCDERFNMYRNYARYGDIYREITSQK